ncbi:MAG TPA: carboxypeptidase regulatory-like domain-containing protein [Sandaracinaceae bacterium]
MVRSRIGSHGTREDVAETAALSGSARRAPLALAAREREPRRALDFVFEIALPWIRDTARTVALGAMLALGGCEQPHVDIDGVVLDARTGAPIAGAQITTGGGRTVTTGPDGRFSVTAERGERVEARADGRCQARARVTPGRPLTLRMFERLEAPAEVAAEAGAEVRIEVRARCDEGATIAWRELAGPPIAPDRWRVEDGGRTLIVRLPRVEPAAYTFEASLPAARREVRIGSTRAPHRARWVRAHERARARRAADAGTQEWCASCHADGDPERTCAGCHDAAMHPQRAAHAPFGPAECARCHDGAAFVAALRALDAGDRSPRPCTSCHDPDDAVRPRGLRVFDRVDAIAGAPAGELGSGAICASCHGAPDADGVVHAPQAAVLLGRGARTVPAIDPGPHRVIVDTCARCHTAPADAESRGHAIAARATCAPCHGSGVNEDEIAVRDWDGDGVAGGVRAEHARALARAREALRARIAALSVRGACGRTAADVAMIGARLALVDARGVALGDCDEDGSFDPGETPTSLDALPRSIADAAHDLAMIERDGSEGVHHPAYAFRVIAAATNALR